MSLNKINSVEHKHNFILGAVCIILTLVLVGRQDGVDMSTKKAWRIKKNANEIACNTSLTLISACPV